MNNSRVFKNHFSRALMLLIFLAFSSVAAQGSAFVQIIVERQSSAAGLVKLKSLTQGTVDCSSGCEVTWEIGTTASVEVEGLDPITTIAIFNIGVDQHRCVLNLAATNCSFTVQPLLEQNTVKVTLAKPEYAGVIVGSSIDQNVVDLESNLIQGNISYTDPTGQGQTKHCVFGGSTCGVNSKVGTGVDIQLTFTGSLFDNPGWVGCDTASSSSCTVLTRAAGVNLGFSLYRKRGNINFKLLGSPEQTLIVNIKNLRTGNAFDQTFQKTQFGTYVVNDLGTDSYLLTVTRFSVLNCTSTISSNSSNVIVQSAATVDASFTVQSDKCKLVINAVNGHVVSDPVGLVDCTGTCEVFLTPGVYSLVSSPNTGFAFTNWQKYWFVPKFTDARVSAFGVGIPYTATFVTATPGNADLQLSYTTPKLNLATDENAVFSLKVTNAGSGTASDVHLSTGLFMIENNTTIGLTALGSATSSQGSCSITVTLLSCAVADMPSNSSVTVTFQARRYGVLTGNLKLLNATTSSGTIESNWADNIAQLDGDNNPPPPPGNVTVALGSSNPVASTVLKGSSNNPALQVLIMPPVGSSVTDYALAGITLQASGTGLDSSDITAVKLFPDNNGNSLVDAGEVALQISSGVFTANDGTLNLSFAPTGILGGRNYLVALDFNSSLAMNQFGTALGSMFLLGLIFSKRRKFGLGLLGLAALIALSSCDDRKIIPIVPTPETRTYKLALTAINLQKNGLSVTVTGLPIAGNEISVVK